MYKVVSTYRSRLTMEIFTQGNSTNKQSCQKIQWTETVQIEINAFKNRRSALNVDGLLYWNVFNVETTISQATAHIDVHVTNAVRMLCVRVSVISYVLLNCIRMLHTDNVYFIFCSSMPTFFYSIVQEIYCYTYVKIIVVNIGHFDFI